LNDEAGRHSGEKKQSDTAKQETIPAPEFTRLGDARANANREWLSMCPYRRKQLFAQP
jgi:hypothetical protein